MTSKNESRNISNVSGMGGMRARRNMIINSAINIDTSVITRMRSGVGYPDG
jgi:hypothetical protein